MVIFSLLKIACYLHVQRYHVNLHARAHLVFHWYLYNKLNNVFTVGARTLRVWSREVVLSSTSENVDGMEQALFWR